MQPGPWWAGDHARYAAPLSPWLRPEYSTAHGAGLSLEHARWGFGKAITSVLVSRQWPRLGRWGCRQQREREERELVACAGATRVS